MTADSRGPFRHAEFRHYWVARLLVATGLHMQTVAIAWQVYEITDSAFYLGLVGLVRFLPVIGLTLVAGHVADRHDRRAIILVCMALQAMCAASLGMLSLAGNLAVAPIFAVVALLGAAQAFNGPALASLAPNLVPAALFPVAVAWNASANQGATLVGPALGGLIFVLGAEAAYGASAAIIALGLALATLIRARPPPAGSRSATFGSVIAGIAFIWRSPPILGAISLDLFAVLLGGAMVLLPIFARDILEVGPWGFGLLRSSPAVGALAIAVWLAHRPLRRRAGATMLVAVALYGLATIAFGLSRDFGLSLAALGVLGAADMLSVVVRQTLVQISTPDEMRGRVSAVNSLAIGASNHLGDFESGLVAAWLGVVPAVLLGGALALVVAAVWAWRFPGLRRVDRMV